MSCSVSELIVVVEQNISLAKSDDTLTKAMKLNLKYSNTLMFPDSINPIIAAGKFLIVTKINY